MIKKVLTQVRIGPSRFQKWIPVEEIVPPAIGFLENDPDPTLGADLKLDVHSIIGQLEKETLVIDGGLL